MVEQKHKTTLEIGVKDREVIDLGRHVHEALDPQPVKAFGTAVARLNTRLTELNKTLDETKAKSQGVIQIVGGGGGGGGPGGPGGGGGGPGGGGGGGTGKGAAAGTGGSPKQPSFWNRAGATAVGSYVGAKMAGGAQRGMGMATAATHGEGALEGVLGGIPLIGPLLSGMVGAARKYSGQSIQFAQAQSGVAGQLGAGFDAKTMGAGGALTQRAAGFGIDRQRLPGMVSQFGQQSHLRGAELSSFSPFALEAQQTLGVNAGAIGKAMGTSGGSMSAVKSQRMTEEAIGAGIEAGFHKSQIGGFIEEIAGHVEGLRSRGIMMEPTSLLSMTRMLSGTGAASLQGKAGLAAAKGMGEVVRGAGKRSDHFSALAMRVARNVSGGSHFDAMKLLQSDPDAVTPGIINDIASKGGSIPAKAIQLEHAMNGAITLEQAEEMLMKAEDGGITMDDVNTIKAGKGAMAKEREGQEGLRSGVALTEAAERNLDLATGDDVVKTMQRVGAAERGLSHTGAKAAEQGIKRAEKYASVFGKGGGGVEQLGGMVLQDMGKVFDLLANRLEKLFDTVDDVVDEKVNEAREGIREGVGNSGAVGKRVAGDVRRAASTAEDMSSGIVQSWKGASVNVTGHTVSAYDLLTFLFPALVAQMEVIKTVAGGVSATLAGVDTQPGGGAAPHPYKFGGDNPNVPAGPGGK